MQTPGAELLNRLSLHWHVAFARGRGVRSLVRWLMAFLVIAPGAALAQTKDAELKAAAAKVADSLRSMAIAMVPDRVRVSIYPQDGRVYDWSIEVATWADIAALAKDVGTDPNDRVATLDRWADRLAAKLFMLTKDEVSHAGIDKGFNPETDIEISVHHRMPKPLADPPPRFKDKPDWYWVSYTGTRRNPLYNDANEIVRPASKPPTGGSVRVVIEPLRAEWGFRETLTGRVSITNPGRARVHVSIWWSEHLSVTDSTGRRPESFHIMGNIDPGPNTPWYVFISPGETHTEEFNVFTDRAYTMSSGYYLAPGIWEIHPPESLGENIEVECLPAKIAVRTRPGEYTGPRILESSSTGSRLVLIREDGTVEAIDPRNGQRFGSWRSLGQDDGWFLHSRELAMTSDARLLARFNGQQNPISIERLFGPAPPIPKLNPPKNLALGTSGLRPMRFLPDDRTLVCLTNDSFAFIDVQSGEARFASIPKARIRISPDGANAVACECVSSWIDDRGLDTCTITVIDLRDQKNNRDVVVKGHGESPDLHAARSCVFLTDEFESSFLQIPYANQPTREVKTAGPCDFIGETSDGTLAAFAWPLASKDHEVGPTTIGVYRTSDGERIATISLDKASGAVLVSNPPRIVAQTRIRIVNGFNGGEWLSEAAQVFDALTGEKLLNLDLTPPEPSVEK